jgi:hypothetical protein
MTYRSDPAAAETAVAFLERSVAAAPGYGDALFFLAFIRLYGLDDAGGARPLIQELLSFDDLPDGFETELEAMLADADGASQP